MFSSISEVAAGCRGGITVLSLHPHNTKGLGIIAGIIKKCEKYNEKLQFEKYNYRHVSSQPIKSPQRDKNKK